MLYCVLSIDAAVPQNPNCAKIRQQKQWKIMQTCTVKWINEVEASLYYIVYCTLFDITEKDIQKNK